MINFKHLSKEDRELYCQASCDLESGNYLRFYRNNEQLQAIQDVVDAENAVEPTKRQTEITEWVKACSDYDYAKDNGYLDEKGEFYSLMEQNRIESVIVFIVAMLLILALVYACSEIFFK